MPRVLRDQFCDLFGNKLVLIGQFLCSRISSPLRNTLSARSHKLFPGKWGEVTFLSASMGQTFLQNLPTWNSFSLFHRQHFSNLTGSTTTAILDQIKEKSDLTVPKNITINDQIEKQKTFVLIRSGIAIVCYSVRSGKCCWGFPTVGALD